MAIITLSEEIAQQVVRDGLCIRRSRGGGFNAKVKTLDTRHQAGTMYWQIDTKSIYKKTSLANGHYYDYLPLGFGDWVEKYQMEAKV